MIVHLIDGTYELFRQFYGQMGRHETAPKPLDAARGVVDDVLRLLESGATHVAVATDHVIESFRNELWETYKDGSGIDPDLRCQFEPLEDALRSLGVAVFAMVEFEADDALAAAAWHAAADDRVEQVIIRTVDKDLGQCVGAKIVQYDRKSDRIMDRGAIIEKFGVPPESIADYLALVGDSADGFPGLAGWGAKSAGALLSRYGTIEAIPDDVASWDVAVRGAAKLATTLAANRDLVAVFKTLAILRADAPVGAVDDWEWHGPDLAELQHWCDRFATPRIADRAKELAAQREKSRLANERREPK